MARLRASQLQEQREAARETDRLAMRNRRANLANLRGQQLDNLRRARRDFSRIDLNRAAFRYDYNTDYSLHVSVCIGPMDVVCEYTGALKYSGETQGLCCLSGKVKLPVLTPPPEPLHLLLRGDTPESIHFLANTQKYNGCFQMTSFGTDIIEEPGYNPTFKDNKYLMNCCKWYLIWLLRRFTDSMRNYPAGEFTLFAGVCNEFLSICFDMLEHLKGNPLHFEVYDCLCDVYIMFSKELEAPIKSNKQFEALQLQVKTKQWQELLGRFIEQHTINNKEMTLERRCAYVVKYVNLVHLNILPIGALATVFKYYYKYNADYESIIESSLNDITKFEDENAIVLIVLFTLTTVYEGIITKYNAVDIRTEEARNLKLLVKQFLAFKYFRTPKRLFKNFFYFSIRYISSDKSKYAFLHFIKYFTDLIVDMDDKKDIYNMFLEKIPAGSEKDEEILFFANHLKTLSTNKVISATSKAILTSREKVVPKTKKESTKKTETNENERPKNIKRKAEKEIVPKKVPKATFKSKLAQSSKAVCKSKNKSKRDETETEVSEDDLTIHDSESDIEDTLSNLRL